jgi:hypothetical protein
MVRAIKLEQTPSGTYLNPSLGTFVSANVSGTPIGNQLRLSARRTSPTELVVTVIGAPGQRFRLESSHDFFHWSNAGEATLADSTMELPVSIDAGSAGIFLRSVALP